MKKYFPLFILINLIVFSSCAEKTSIKCIICNSNDNPNCAQNPKKITEEPCKDDEDRCTVRLYEQVTRRKCGKKDECEGAQNCHECDPNDKQCSSIYPPDRPRCIQCEGKGCENDKELPGSLPCINYDKDAECFSVVKDNKSTYRGCMSDKKSTVCTQNEDICKICKYSDNNKDCNKDSGKQTVKCYKCSGKDCQRGSKSGSECKIDDKYAEDCETLYGRESCYTLRQGNDVSRGCLNGFNVPTSGVLEKCPPKGEEAKEKCNSKCFDDIKCPQCESTKNPNCGKDDIPSTDCPEYTSACYWCEDQDGNSYRGCGNGNKTLNCNYGYGEPAKKPKRFCYACGKDDPNCATVEKDLPITECKKDNDDCVVMISDDYTIRGCATEVLGDKIKECKEEGLCSLCKSHKCNGGVYPVDRRRCYQCSKCKNLSEGDIKSKPCFMYNPNDKCYTYSDDQSNMFRGCLSDKNTDGCKKSKEKCVYCGIDNCNNASLSKDATLKCVKCDKDKAECAWGQNKTSGETCTGTIAYWQKETCFTYQHNATLVTRGCTFGSKLCDGNDPKCEKCETDSCNVKNLIPFTCLRCRSDNPGEETCGGSLEGIKKLKCDHLGDMQYNDRGCYTEKYGEHIIRGCLIDLSPDVRDKCRDETNKYCDHCLEANCNDKKPPNSSATNNLSFVLLAFAIILAVRTN